MNKIAKKCYEEKFKTQKYEDSNLFHTYEPVIEKIIKITLRKVEKIIDKVIPLDEKCANNMILNNELKKGLGLK